MILEQTPMKIAVNRIPFSGLREEGTFPATAMDLERPDVHPVSDVEVSAFARKAEREVVVQADIHCTVQLSCARCLTQFEQDVTASGTWAYEVLPTDVIDLIDDVRQELILAYPMIPVCRPSCKGLCPICGQNLNAGACEHQAR